MIDRSSGHITVKRPEALGVSTELIPELKAKNEDLAVRLEDYKALVKDQRVEIERLQALINNLQGL